MDNRRVKKRIRLKARYRIYISYGKKLAFSIFILLLSLLLGFKFTQNTLILIPEKTVNYNEKGNVNYKVYLKENDFYEEEYLKENMIYVSSLIKNIEIDYSYLFEASEYIDMTMAYEVVGELSITNENGEKTYFKKEYILDDIVAEKLTQKTYKLDKKTIINYDQYNTIANSFKSTYGINTSNKFTVYLKLNKVSNISNISKINNMSLTIPLSEKSIDINMNSKNIDTSDKMVVEEKKMMVNKKGVTRCIIAFTISLLYLLNIFNLLLMNRKKKSNYDKLLDKYLKEYDRLIISTTTLPNLNQFNVIKIDNFNEMLDVRDNIKLPIMYYNVCSHQKCHLYIIHNNNLYLMTLKAVDMENSNEND